MNQVDEYGPLQFGSLGGDGKLDESQLNIALHKEQRIDRWMLKFGDGLSAILVKETRQALKSRQFVWTYFALLAVILVFALFTLTGSLANDLTSQLGPNLLFGFMCILGFPLGIILPFSTFRSMSKEYEDGTLQMISITTLSPFQIAAGKLGSALLQMLIFVSVLAPCMSFSSLLEGVTIGQIGVGLLVAITGSFSLCCLGLFFGCTVRTSGLSIVSNLFLLGGCIFMYGLFNSFVGALTFQSNFFQIFSTPEGTVGLYGAIAAGLSSAAICFVCATSMIAFDTENRATNVRIAILVQQALFFSFFAAILMLSENSTRMYFTTAVGCSITLSIYWLVMGAMMVSTNPIIGNRVRRGFPKTLFGKSFFGLLMPGLNRAYLFSIANLIGCNLICLLLVAYSQNATPVRLGPGMNLDFVTSSALILINLVYSFLFLSLTFLLLNTLTKFGVSRLNPLFGLLMAAFIALLGPLFGYLIQYSLFYRELGDSYSTLQAFVWWATWQEYLSSGFSASMVNTTVIVGIIVAIVGILAFMTASRSITFTGLETPNRVLRDEQDRKKEIKEEKMKQEEDRFEDLFQETKEPTSSEIGSKLNSSDP